MKKLIATILIAITASLGYVFMPDDKVVERNDEVLGSNFPDTQWTVVSAFDGFVTKFDASKVSGGANPNGQNTETFDGDRFGIRQLGYELFPSGTASTSANAIKSLHTFRRRDGENIMIRSYSTFLEYFDEDLDTWQSIKTGYTDDKDFGFADFTVNADQTSYVYFGNAVDNFSRWSGSHTLLNGTLSGGETTINVDSTSNFENVTGTIEYCGTEVAYTSKTSSTFEVASAHACGDNERLIEAVEETAENPKGNIYLNHDNRLWISGVASSTQVVFFSRYGTGNDFAGGALVVDGTDDDPGFFNLGEGGGAVTGLVMDENSVYILKKGIIRKANLTDTSYALTTLKPFDGKSQTIGLKATNGAFTGGNNVYFVTADNQIMSLGRLEQLDFPQTTPISDAIKNTVPSMNFDDVKGVVFKDRAFFSVKGDTTTSNNDTILVWDIKNGKWLSPIKGWNVDEWTVYDNGTSEDLYFGDSATTNVFKVTNTPQDSVFGVGASWRSKRFNFNAPHLLKDLTDIYIEGLISDNTTLTISLLVDEEGNTQIYQTTVKGTDTDFLFDSPEFNVFGFSPFGVARFGTNDDQSGKKPFRVNMTELRVSPFYNIQLEFASDGDNQQWEILNFAFESRINSGEQLRRLQKPFN